MHYPELEDIKFGTSVLSDAKRKIDLEISRLKSFCEHITDDIDRVNITKSLEAIIAANKSNPIKQIRKNVQHLEDKLCAL